jgi:very-short-patch-repair endonuclease
MGRRSKKHNTHSLNNIETKVYNILISLRVSFKIQANVDKYNVDFLVDDKYIIECYGDFWHCNPIRYPADYFNRGKRKYAKDIWKRDGCRKQHFEEQGYKFLSLWETDINKHPKKVRSNIKQLLRERKREE